MNGVLSYPHFFPPRDWLNLAALCWDKIYTLRESNSWRPEHIEKFADKIPDALDRIDVAEFSSDSDVKGGFEKWISAHASDLASAKAQFASVEYQYLMLDGLVS